MQTFDQMAEHGHEHVSFHYDDATGLRAIVAVHSTVLGPAFGGCRRWHYATEADALYDALRLSEGMTYKAAAANVAIGGGKAVVLLPRHDLRATEAEARAMGRIVDSLGGLYISAEDVGLSPQYVDWMGEETKWITGGSESAGDPSPHTAQGVVNAMRAALQHTRGSRDLAGVTVAIQGAGNVGTNIARILSEHGGRVLVADLQPARAARVAEAYGATVVPLDDILTQECDILAPCALGGVLTRDVIERLECPIVCGGANNILEDYDEDGAALKAREIVYVPDFIANAGGLIELAGWHLGLSSADRQQKIADVESTTLQILEGAKSTSSTYAAAVAFAKQRLTEGPSAGVVTTQA